MRPDKGLACANNGSANGGSRSSVIPTSGTSKTVASEENLRDAGAQEPECTVEYMRIPSTAGAQIIEWSRFLEVPINKRG